jgi:ADP-ribosylglycohydrolase
MKMRPGTIGPTSHVDAAIAGMYIGDALAMPVHWYYNRRLLKADYGHVTDYMAPRNPHPDSILWRSAYQASNPKGEILHDQARFWGRPGIHYHQFLRAGENTLNLKLCTLLINKLNTRNEYDAADFARAYTDYMTTPGNHADTYIEEYHRQFFANYAAGKSPTACGVIEKHISGIIGMIPVVAYYADNPPLAREKAFEHLHLTHLGPKMDAAGAFLVDVLLPVLTGNSLREVLEHQIRRQNNPLLGLPLEKWQAFPDEEVIGRRVSSACYVEDAIPAVAYLALKYHDKFEKGLVVNTNLGGDNAGRGAVLGALLGAANGMAAIPSRWKTGLLHSPPALKTGENVS